MSCPLCRRKGHTLYECKYLPGELRSGWDGSRADFSSERVKDAGDKLKRDPAFTGCDLPFSPDLALLLAVMEDEKAAPNIRSMCCSAIEYYLHPADAIFDWLPFFGHTDDAVVVYLALDGVLKWITPQHKIAAAGYLSK